MKDEQNKAAEKIGAIYAGGYIAPPSLLWADNTHPSNAIYEAVNLLEALKTSDNTGDWYGSIRTRLECYIEECRKQGFNIMPPNKAASHTCPPHYPCKTCARI